MIFRKANALWRGIGTALAAGCVLMGTPAFAQEKAKIEDIYKQALGAAGANQVNIRTNDVPPGWATEPPPLGPHVPQGETRTAPK